VTALALIGCSARKLNRPPAARDLCRGDLFRKALAYAEHRFDRTMILSARYGLLSLGRIIAPYDLTLNTMSQAEHRAWAASIALPPGLDITYLCGRAYHEFLPAGRTPLAGLGIGRQLAWFKARLNDRKTNP
jgi:hypothetical protein